MNTATLCLLVKGNPITHVLLGYKKVGFGEGKYGGFGGKIEAHESIAAATIRELKEEAGIIASAEQLAYRGWLDFVFPALPSWNLQVHVYVTHTWNGEPRESVEMIPIWFQVESIPYQKMWQDSKFWLPLVLWDWHIQAHFSYCADNETVSKAKISVLDNNLTDGYNNGALGNQSR